MSQILWTDVIGTGSPPTGFAPELAVFADVVAQNVLLTLANTTAINTANFGGEDAAKTKFARILWVAHMATLMLRRGIGGTVASQSEGGVSESMAQILKNPGPFDLTSYGQALRVLSVGTPARAGLLVGFR